VLQRVVIGRDFGDALEVVSGLDTGDQIVLNPPDSIAAGQKVRLLPAGAQQ
jgi:multidrug efflux pump subunit AcrA (membrane-fusion protein)